jgi:putative membrane protein
MRIFLIFRTCINLSLGFVVATKYRLRRQFGYDYPDLVPYIQNLSTLAKTAYLVDGPLPEKQWSRLRRVGVDLGIPGARPDPSKSLKGPKYHGNLPFEILTYITAYADIVITSGAMPSPAFQIQVMNALAALTDCLTGMERVLGTPLPLAYRIAISQISWIYILALPFQLVTYLGWVAIPGTLGTYHSRSR